MSKPTPGDLPKSLFSDEERQEPTNAAYWKRACKKLLDALDERDKRIAELKKGFMRSQDELGNRVYIYSEAQYQRQKNLALLTTEAQERGEYGH